MVTIRYAMNLTSFRKYVGTTVATNVSEKTVAVIMENSDQLDGVSCVERYGETLHRQQIFRPYAGIYR